MFEVVCEGDKEGSVSTREYLIAAIGSLHLSLRNFHVI